MELEKSRTACATSWQPSCLSGWYWRTAGGSIASTVPFIRNRGGSQEVTGLLDRQIDDLLRRLPNRLLTILPGDRPGFCHSDGDGMPDGRLHEDSVQQGWQG